MSDRSKMNLEELRKSFPSLDDHSANRLLGGNGNGPWGPIVPVSEATALPDPNNSGGTPGGLDWPLGHSYGSGNGSTKPLGAGGSDYFGINEPTLVSSDDFGWGDGGLGGDSGNGSSPGESGNDQNPGPQQPPDFSDLRHHNQQTPSVNQHRTYNTTAFTMYGKHENGNARVEIAPGGYTDTPLDAFKLNGFVYKVATGYGTLTVTNDFYTTHYSDVAPAEFPFLSPLDKMELWLDSLGNPCVRTDFLPWDTQWNNIFNPP